jgi:hypothetical protein
VCYRLTVVLERALPDPTTSSGAGAGATGSVNAERSHATTWWPRRADLRDAAAHTRSTATDRANRAGLASATAAANTATATDNSARDAADKSTGDHEPKCACVSSSASWWCDGATANCAASCAASIATATSTDPETSTAAADSSAAAYSASATSANANSTDAES